MNKSSSAQAAQPPKEGNHRSDQEQQATAPKNSPLYYTAAAQARAALEGQEIDRKEEAIQKRAILSFLTDKIRPLVKEGKFQTVNEGIIKVFYTRGEHQTFKSFNGWKEEGKKIKKGSRGFAVWSRPKKVTRKEAGKPDEQREYFNLAYLFSNAQVQDDQ